MFEFVRSGQFLKVGFLLVSLVMVNGVDLFCQNQPRQQPFGNWVMYFGDNKINKKWGIHSEYQARNYLIPNTLKQTLIRFGVNHYLSPVSVLTGGYGFFYTSPTFNGEGNKTLENRIWQQLIMRHRTYNIFLEHRYRLEQRFVNNLTTEDFIYEDRMRYRLQALIPLYVASPWLRHYFIASYNELFMNLGKQLAGQYFDRNRFYLAMGYQLNPKFNIQIGYLNQVISVPGFELPDINHNLQISVVYNMDDLSAFFLNR
jgi:hypothetical protein